MAVSVSNFGLMATGVQRITAGDPMKLGVDVVLTYEAVAWLADPAADAALDARRCVVTCAQHGGLQRVDRARAKPAARRAASTARRDGHPARWSSTRPHACISA